MTQTISRYSTSDVAVCADPGGSRPDQINHRSGGRRVLFDDLDGHLFELMTFPYRPEPERGALSERGTDNG